MSKRYTIKTQGIALISVLFIAAVVLILASTFIYMIYRERQSTTAARLISDSLQTADAISERARLELVYTYKNSYLTSPNFVKQVGTVLAGGNSSISSINAYVNTAQAVTINSKTGWWKIVDASPIADVNFPPEIIYIDIAATAETGSGVQTVIRRINMGQSKIFDLAMLSERTDCIYCHVRVKGDVGALGSVLRPGWGSEGGGGIGSGGHYGGSVVSGTAFIAGTASTDATDLTGTPKKINGALFDDAKINYNGNRLPKDENGDGVPDFPALTREIGQLNTEGSISGGKIYTIPHSTTLASIPTSGFQARLSNGKYDGNVILEGTKDNPLILDGDMYFSGDVIIKGYVQGRGAVYSGRNTYVAGNINYVDPPANCATAGNPDNCARNAIAQGKDELRLASRGNIVLGDYTEYNLDGSKKTWQELQAADYFKAQFNLWGGGYCYDKQTGDELRSKDGVYYNVEGEPISGSYVTCPADSYSYSMRPGKVSATDGSFSTWLSDGLYKQILGTEQRTYDTWRQNVQQSTLTTTFIQQQFAKYNLSAASIEDIRTHGPGSFDLTNAAGEIIGTANWNNSLGMIRVMIDPAFDYEKQITHVDAFLYANQRIAGKTFNAPFVINGGMIGKQIGILTPGMIRPGFASASRYNILDGSNKDCGHKSYIDKFIDDVDVNADGVVDSDDDAELSPLYQPESEDCALTINYDYRLRNGGLGFNLVAPKVGHTLTWQIADSADQQVRP